MFNKEKGFTLIELLVVIAVIGILSTVVLVSLSGVREKARDSRRQSDINQIQLAMEMYNTNSGSYLMFNGTNSATAIGSYLSVVPVDPTNVFPLQYAWASSTASYYCVFAKLEGAATTTYYCASNKGTISVATTSKDMTLTNCCGVNVTN